MLWGLKWASAELPQSLTDMSYVRRVSPMRQPSPVSRCPGVIDAGNNRHRIIIMFRRLLAAASRGADAVWRHIHGGVWIECLMQSVAFGSQQPAAFGVRAEMPPRMLPKHLDAHADRRRRQPPDRRSRLHPPDLFSRGWESPTPAVVAGIGAGAGLGSQVETGHHEG